ncbi:MAG: methionine synthase [Candidatus Hinthialibacter antarcticus]|nr:methionine synthase [Candidatus Hinthialibacter antarcticus]
MSNADLFQQRLKDHIVVFDGAMGTSIQNLDLAPDDFGGADLEGCNENLVLTKPDVIETIHRQFFEAGADIVESNTFGSASLVLAEYDLQDMAEEITLEATRIARRAADAMSTPSKPRFVAGSMGPTTKSITVTGGVTFNELIDTFYQQAKALIEGGSDVLLLETQQDTRNAKAGLFGVHKAFEVTGRRLPIMVSGTIEPMGAMLAGQSVDALYASLEHADLLSIGINCATGPKFMTDHIRTLAEMAQCNISCIPNAGLPDEEGNYNETPEMIAGVLEQFVHEGWINILGGCCGTTPEHIAAIAKLAENKKPRQPQTVTRCHMSGIEYFEATDEKRPILVGERTNVIGSRKFKRLICENKFEEASEIGRKQARTGAHILDVCLANPDREEMEDMETFLEQVIKKVKLPLMIDSTDAAVIERSLTYCQGKSIINSINLEDGEERFEQVVPMARQFGAAFVVGCIDEDPDQGMAVTVERKVEIAKRSHDLLVNKYGVKSQEIIFDPLVFPCATGDKNYIGSAEQTIKGVAAIKRELPECKTILGVSNVSFGLPAAGREVLNSVFLYHCVKAGLDMAIVNTEKLERYASISDEEKKLADDLLFNRGEDPIATFAAFYKDKKVSDQPAMPRDSMPLEERLSNCIMEGSKEGLIEDLNEALKKYKPLEIINGPLMAGMDEVGRLFGANELIVAEVLQSAEVMKAAVSHLEPLMEKSDIHVKAKMLLATVKGDVHDIGKNLVDIIFSNNGYQIINLGIKVLPETLVKAYQDHKADMIGLSGLLVKSAQQMVTTVQDLKRENVQVPVLVGGAALSNAFTRNKIAPAYGELVVYAKDAMSGLDLANQISDPKRRPGLEKNILEMTEMLQDRAKKKAEAAPKPKKKRVSVLRNDHEIPTPPDFKSHLIQDHPFEELMGYVNPQMLYGKHLGLRGAVEKMWESGDEKALMLKKQVEECVDLILSNQILKPRAVFKFFPARRDGDAIAILNSARSKEIDRLVFPRQSEGDELCLSDFVSSDRDDAVSMFVVSTADETLYEWADRFKQDGEYLKSHMLQAIAIESAEGLAELLHKKIREMWGTADAASLSKKELFHAKYHGLRVSFGYPACPRLEDQRILFQLLDATNQIQVKLTEGDMMEPEASVSALVFHHPDAKYFNISDSDLQAFEESLKPSAPAAV